MNFSFARVFCATPGNLNNELDIFHDVLAQVNENVGQPTKSLFVPVSVPPNMSNMALFRPVLDQNVRDCTFFVQLFHDGWGTPQRNFQPQFQLASELLNDARSPMKAIAAFIRKTSECDAAPAAAELRKHLAELRQPIYVYRDLPEFRRLLLEQITRWLQSE